MMALTGYYRRNILDKLQMKVTYTVDSYSYKNIGFQMSYGSAFNVYLMADQSLEYKSLAKANSLSFQFGFYFQRQ
jgi:hypothetical protein